MAIQIKVTKGIPEEGGSQFFGSPAVPAGWEDSFEDTVIFLCQIRLADIAALDRDDRLPHTGYLYIFLDTAQEPYTPVVLFSESEPDTVIDDFNDIGEEYAPLTEGWAMSFLEAADDSDGIRLFGKPSGWPYADDAPELLLQYDPLASDMPFLSSVDGYAWLFRKRDGYTLHIERT